MCAISGIIEFNDKIDVQSLRIMTDLMAQRGPDEHGIFVDGHVGLGHRRLSIIDVKSGQQPMSVDDGNYVIVYNGETYNFLEVKEQLLKEGVSFKTDSDTEVILQAYCCWGIEKCLEAMDGMWAFAIYDKKQQKVVIARDRYGEKPLYYQYDEDRLVFASELKAFRPNSSSYEIDKTALNLFLSLCYIPAPYTIYKGIKKMKPGHYFEINLNDNSLVDHQYDDVQTEFRETVDDHEYASGRIRELLTDSIKKRMISDVPMGAFLSGGIDSSIVCCLMSQLSKEPINTFSIGFFEKDYDETERAKIVVDHIKSNHTQFTLDYSDVLGLLDDIILYYDEPYGDSSAIPSYYVAKLAKEKVSVVLTGDCADELFGGYEKYLANYYVEKYRRVPKPIRAIFELLVSACPVTPYTNNLLRKLKKVIRNSQLSGFDLYYNFMTLGCNDHQRKRLLAQDKYVDVKAIYSKLWESIPNDLSYLQKEQVMDVKGVLEGDMFPKMDRACMHVSLENRAPFIDRRILKLALNLSDELKICGKEKKVLLKKAFRDILPKETLNFKKSGFGVPVDYWLKHELKDDLLKLIDKEFIEQQGLFDYKYIMEIVKDHLNNKENYKSLLWNLFVFQKWYTKIYKS